MATDCKSVAFCTCTATHSYIFNTTGCLWLPTMAQTMAPMAKPTDIGHSSHQFGFTPYTLVP